MQLTKVWNRVNLIEHFSLTSKDIGFHFWRIGKVRELTLRKILSVNKFEASVLAKLFTCLKCSYFVESILMSPMRNIIWSF